LRWHLLDPFEERVRAPLRALRNSGRTFRPIFVGGASGSGTSLLALSVGQHLDCAGVIYETNFQVARDSFLHVPHLDTFANAGEYQAFMTPKPDWEVDAARGALQACYRRYCSGSSEFVVDKGPDINLVRAAFLHHCYPDAHHVLIFRDPVANVEGLRRKWRVFGDGPLDATIGFWHDIHRAFLNAAAAMPGRAHAVEYEALVEAPDAVLTTLAERLAIPRSAQGQRLRESPNVEGQGIRNVSDGKIGYVTDANQRARARLAPDEADRIETALAPLERELREASFTITRDGLRAAPPAR
jgi:hypothetical protein